MATWTAAPTFINKVMHMKSLIRFGILLAIALSVLSVLPVAPAQATTPVPYIIITHDGYYMCIQPEYEARINGLTIVIQPCNTDDRYQRWEFISVRTNSSGAQLWHLENVGSGMCLDLRDGVTADWSPVQQWTCNTTSTTMLWTREWMVGAYARFRNERSGKCLDVRADAQVPGTVLQIYRCGDTNYAQWFALHGLY